jgi:hypothetical protein
MRTLTAEELEDFAEEYERHQRLTHPPMSLPNAFDRVKGCHAAALSSPWHWLDLGAGGVGLYRPRAGRRRQHDPKVELLMIAGVALAVLL